ncbi:acetyltransferase [Curtobacterium sp. MCPF17_047]|uniref:NeuD/PglB/VioB family sugar acetyltransferase n=1 Tax=unclassified Curtobacterium TaxID=257496 RepID=UPI000DA83590|nr:MULTISPECIES: NeuD/PglB/VioB family sugar acetyltransferase [unclassified Curtobacterium]PZE61518.1 acetyltransferase [Curtobacterium sp. MCPF17_001]PZF67022.1 acetyltransferase [Curtobacterium sp. MCPF17_047]
MTDASPVTVIGAGGFGRETLDIALACGRPLHGVVDDAPTGTALRTFERLGIRFLGGMSDWLPTARGRSFVVAVGAPAIRSRLDLTALRAGASATSLVHPSASIGSLVSLGTGAVVCANATVGSNVCAGRHLHVNPGAVIGHDVHLGDHVSVNPRSALSGDVLVGDRALIGAGAVVLQGLSIGPDAVVGAAAAVTRDVTAGTTVVGVPARTLPRQHTIPSGAS